jgi:hypothetical protein
VLAGGLSAAAGDATGQLLATGHIDPDQTISAGLFGAALGAAFGAAPRASSALSSASEGNLRTALSDDRGAISFGRPEKAAKTGDGLLSPGPYAGRSIPGDGTRRWTRPQRDELNEIMGESGCH